jgi:hypothetical protein
VLPRGGVGTCCHMVGSFVPGRSSGPEINVGNSQNFGADPELLTKNSATSVFEAKTTRPRALSATMSTPTNPNTSAAAFSSSDGAIKQKSSDQNPERWRASKQIKMILACLSLVSFVVAIDATILVPALPVSFAHNITSSSLTSTRLLPKP